MANERIVPRAAYDRVVTAVSISMNRESIEVTPFEIQERSNRANPVAARQLISFIMREHLKCTVERVGMFMKKNHSTITYSEGRAVTLIEIDGSIGRSYLRAIGLLGFEAPPWLKVNTSYGRPVEKVVKVKKVEPPKSLVADNGYIVPMEWSIEEKETLRRWRHERSRVDNSPDRIYR